MTEVKRKIDVLTKLFEMQGLLIMSFKEERTSVLNRQRIQTLGRYTVIIPQALNLLDLND